jgi:hypothetical protein
MEAAAGRPQREETGGAACFGKPVKHHKGTSSKASCSCLAACVQLFHQRAVGFALASNLVWLMKLWVNSMIFFFFLKLNGVDILATTHVVSGTSMQC